MRPFLLSIFLLLFSLSSFGQSLLEQGKAEKDPRKKIDLFTKALEDEKKDNWTYYYRAWAYYELRRYSQALRDFQAAEKAEGNLDMSYVWSGMAWVYYDLKMNKEAKIYAQKSVDARPDNYSGYNIMGWLGIRTDNYGEAARQFTTYIEKGPKSYLGYYNRSYANLLLKNYEAVLKDCEAGLALKPGHDQLTERKALALLKLGRDEEGIAIIKEKIKYQADDPISLSNIGNLFYRTGDYHGAIEYHTRGIKLYQQKIKEDPKFIDIHKADVYNIYMSRGDAYEALKEYPHAMQNYSTATRIDPKNYRAWLEIGELQTYQDNYREACQAYERAYSIDPTLKIGWVNLGFCYDHQNLRQKAIQAYSRGIAADPENGLLYNNRGFAYLETKQMAKAKADLEKAIQVDPALVMSHVSLGEYFYEVGQYEAAIDKFDQALDMENGSVKAYAAAWYTRGRSHQQLEKYETAITDFREVKGLEPKNSEAYEHSGICHYELEQYCEAYKDLKKALELDAHAPERKALDAPKYLAKLTRNPCN